MLDKFFDKLSFSISVGILLSLMLQSLFLFVIKGNPDVYFDGHFVSLWTHDAGLYGYYAKELLSGANLAFDSEHMAGWLLYAFVKVTPFSIGQAIFYLPVFLSSLIVVPIFMISRFYGLQKVGFFVGVLSTITYGYYYRSFFGYYDTDILNLFFPLLVIWGLIGLSQTQNIFYALLSAFGMLFFSLWYHSFLPIGAGIVGIWAIYTLLFEREKLVNYLLIFMLAVSFLHVNIFIKLILIVAIFALNFQRYKTHQSIFAITFLAISAIGAFFINVDKFYQRALEYIDKSLFIKSSNLDFVNTLNTVAEANGITFHKWATLTASNLPIAFLGIFGLVLLIVKHRSFLMFLPLILLGLLSLVAGERFVMYGVVAFSFGLCYFIFILSDSFPKYQKASFLVMLAIIFGFYIGKIIDFSKTEKPVFNGQDLEVLSIMPENKDNFTLSWWDYGWPLWYETETKTLIDNGKHFEDNYIISELLYQANQAYVANASKNVVNLYEEAKSKGHYKLVPYLFSIQKPYVAMQNLGKSTTTSRPIYWYLNTSYLKAGINIKKFSSIELKTGKRLGGSVIVYLKKTNQIRFNKKDGKLNLNGQKFNIQSYTNTTTKEYITYKGINLHFIKTPTHYFVCTKNIYDSFLVQALLLQNVNEKVFEVVAKNDTSMLLKVK